MFKEYLKKLTSIFVIKKTDERIHDLLTEKQKEFIKNNSHNEHSILDKSYLMNYDYNSLEEPVILNPEGKKTLLVVDDIVVTELLYRADLHKMESQYDVKPYEDFKIVKCLGKDAGFIAFKYLSKNPIDYGIIDITLEQQIRDNNIYIADLDGIDIVSYIKEVNPNFKYVLCTAHSLNKNNNLVDTYNKKIQKNLKTKLENIYINKNTNRVDRLYNLLYGDKNDDK